MDVRRAGARTTPRAAITTTNETIVIRTARPRHARSRNRGNDTRARPLLDDELVRLARRSTRNAAADRAFHQEWSVTPAFCPAGSRAYQMTLSRRPGRTQRMDAQMEHLCARGSGDTHRNSMSRRLFGRLQAHPAPSAAHYNYGLATSASINGYTGASPASTKS